MTAIGWKSCLLWTAHTPCGVNSLRKSNQIKSNQPSIPPRERPSTSRLASKALNTIRKSDWSELLSFRPLLTILEVQCENCISQTCDYAQLGRTSDKAFTPLVSSDEIADLLDNCLTALSSQVKRCPQSCRCIKMERMIGTRCALPTLRSMSKALLTRVEHEAVTVLAESTQPCLLSLSRTPLTTRH
jgi:hypothetical protein